MTRRELLAGTALSAATLWARNHWDRSRISAITDEIAATADDAADFAHQQGMLFVEVRYQPGSNREYATGREADAQAAATHLSNENIKVSVINTSLHAGTHLDELRQALRCAQIMGASQLRIFAGPGTFQQTADAITEMAAECEKQKVTLLLENDAATSVATCADLAAVMKLAPSKWVGINWKPAPDGYALLPKKRILNVRVPAASLAPGRPESMNWKNILMSLDKDGYNGRITLETGLTGKAGFDTARDSLDQLVHIVREVS